MSNRSVSTNGDFLRMVSDWFKKHAKDTKQKIQDVRAEHKNGMQYIRVKSEKEQSIEKIKYILKQTINTGDFSFSKLFEYLSKSANKVFIDNKILRKLEQVYADCKHSDKKFIEWIKKHPSIASYLSYYTVMFLMSIATIGGMKSSKQYDDNNGDKQYKKEIIASNKDSISNKNEIVETEKMYDLESDTFEADFVNDNWDDIVIGLLEFETWHHKPIKHKGETRYTYGPGLTYVYISDTKGGYQQKPCKGKYKTMVESYSNAQMLEQVKRHISYKSEVLHIIKKQFLKHNVKEVSQKQLLGLLFAAYQLPSNVKGIIDKIVDAGENEQKQIDAFQYYTGNKMYRIGTLKRRWWCAAYYTGKISSSDVLQLNRDVFVAININTIMKNNHFKMDNSTIEYALAKTNDRSTVVKFIDDHNLDIKHDKAKEKKFVVINEAENPSVVEMTTALTAYNKGNYAEAIIHYEQSIELDVDNIEAYSSIAISYKKLGDKYRSQNKFTEAEKCYKKCCAYVQQGNLRMNANRTLLLDRALKASLYYNAGQARDALADIYVERQDINSAIEQYRKASLNYGTCVENAEESGLDDAIIKIYKEHQSKSKLHMNNYKKQIATQRKQQKTKKQVFEDSILKLKQRKVFDPKILSILSDKEHKA